MELGSFMAWYRIYSRHISERVPHVCVVISFVTEIQKCRFGVNFQS